MSTVYKKHHSFNNFFSHHTESIIQEQTARVIKLTEDNNDELIERARKHLVEGSDLFKITQFIAEELHCIADIDVPRYIYHRYRYDVFPKKEELDCYPPYVQIEPSSICNYRCTFCFQNDSFFKSKQDMGEMSFELFKKVIDELEGNVEFVSLASRGEPLICKEIDQFLKYCSGKFLNLKLNTNASCLTEAHCHAILSGGVNTLVFSADSADKESYAKYRRGGDLKIVYKKIKMFKQIRESYYPDSKIITRISGVKIDKTQSMSEMVKVWGDLVDQISFVNYNPWENVYVSKTNDISQPCSDLWRRLFIWFDGKVNPCDTDFKSSLSKWSYEQNTIKQIWSSKEYNELRISHLESKRDEVEPCRRCSVI